MKIVTWNINGLRSLKTPLKELLDSFKADVICFQETKIARNDLTEELVLVDGYNSYFSCSKIKLGYSGVATFVSDALTPTYAEIGLTGFCDSDLTNKKITRTISSTERIYATQFISKSEPHLEVKFKSDTKSKSDTQPNILNSVIESNCDDKKSKVYNSLPQCEQLTHIAESTLFLTVKETAVSLLDDFSVELLKSIDLEGRCVITEHIVKSKDSQKLRHIVIVNVYCPRSGENESRKKFKISFYQVLAKRCEEIIKTGRQVIIVGDINTAHKPIDHCDPLKDEIFLEDEGRQWLDSFLIPGAFPDVCEKSKSLCAEKMDKCSNVNNTLKTEFKCSDKEFYENFFAESDNIDFFSNDIDFVKKENMENYNNNINGLLSLNNINSSKLNIYDGPLKDKLHVEKHNLEPNKMAIFVDITRMVHPDRKNMFTNWCTLTGARATNYGQRIDYIFADAHTACNLILFSDILPDVLGSDHCPVFCTLSCTGVRADLYPVECTQNMFNNGKQKKIIEYFSTNKKNDNILNEDIKFESNKVYDFYTSISSVKNLHTNKIRDNSLVDLEIDRTKIANSNKNKNVKKVSNHGHKKNLKLSTTQVNSSLKNSIATNNLCTNKNSSKILNFSLKKNKLNFNSNKINFETSNLHKCANTKAYIDELYIKNQHKSDKFSSAEICMDNFSSLQANSFLTPVSADLNLKECLEIVDNCFDLPSSQNSLEYQLLIKNTNLSNNTDMLPQNGATLSESKENNLISEIKPFIDQNIDAYLIENNRTPIQNSYIELSKNNYTDLASFNSEDESTDLLVCSARNDDDNKRYSFFNKIKHQKIKPVMCSGHKEPCVLRIVKKHGLNHGKKFWTCARPEGHRTNKAARCNYFMWCENIVNHKN